jgi:hypothetical protein
MFLKENILSLQRVLLITHRKTIKGHKYEKTFNTIMCRMDSCGHRLLLCVQSAEKLAVEIPYTGDD